jgi:hypothetical protein
MSFSRLVQLGSAAVAVAAISGIARAEDPALRKDLEAVSRRTVLFGHQSVGTNILDGVQDLASREHVPLAIVDVGAAPGALPKGISHVFVERNGDPGLKLQSFDQALQRGPSEVEVALLKFCFVDLFEQGDPKALFERYQASFRTLQARHPRTTFVHVTMPLTTIPSGPKAFVKRLLGRERSEHHNQRREQFNAMMRAAYQGREPLFDLASLESTRLDGTRETYPLDGQPVSMLVAEYTVDGGHLNGLGRQRAARELLRILASVPARAPVPVTGSSR